jgi:hypothetical protein
LWLVVETKVVDAGSLLHLHRAYEFEVPAIWMTTAKVELELGTLVFIQGETMSFVDPLSLEVRSVDIRIVYRFPRPRLSTRLLAYIRNKPLV